MVVTTGPQLNDTWLEWKSFMYPAKGGPKWAYSVPKNVADQLNSAYSLMIDILTAQFWVLVVGIVVAVMLQRKKPLKDQHLFSSVMPSLWNKNADLLSAVTDVFMSVIAHDGRATPSPVMWMVVATAVVLYAGQKAMGVLVAPKIILDTAAPAMPDIVYLPDLNPQSNLTIINNYILGVPWALRAVATATAAMATLSQSVFVSRLLPIGTWTGSDDDRVDDSQSPQTVYQVTYNYSVTGADMGIQRYPELTLAIEGACYTEYNWYLGPENVTEYGGMQSEKYYLGGNASNELNLSPLDGPMPMLTFLAIEPVRAGAVAGSNSTWWAATSAANKYSITASTDPWYVTTETVDTTAPFVVATGRPVLACWEDAVWSYRGHRANMTGLVNGGLPGVQLSDGMQYILAYSLSQPMIARMGGLLGANSLAVGSNSIGAIIDAHSNTLANDLHRLVVAAYVATTNILTTTTLYPVSASDIQANILKSTSGQSSVGAGDFVVWTPQAAALDLTIVIAVPVLLVVFLLLNILLALATPIGKAKALAPMELFYIITQNHGTAQIHFDRWHGAQWRLDGNRVNSTPPESGPSESQAPVVDSNASGATAGEKTAESV